MNLFELERFEERLLVNVLAEDEKNAAAVLEAGDGYVVPGIAAADFPEIDGAVERVLSLKKAAPAVSVGLGGGGSFREWERVLKIAERARPEHINQPFEKAPFVQGYLAAEGIHPVINALVSPAGEIGKVRLATGMEMEAERFLDLAAALGIVSVKVMPVNGLAHLEELVFIAEAAAKRGIRGIEPAGGIKSEHLPVLYQVLKKTKIELIMPHIFGDVLAGKGRSDPAKVENLFRLLKRR